MSSFSQIGAASGVSMKPGAIAFARIPCSAHSSAITFVS